MVAVAQRRGTSAPAGVLEPAPTGWAEQLAAWRGRSHAFLTVLGVLLACYVALAALLIGSGLMVTHIVAHSRIGHWDEHVNAWFAAHRRSPFNTISADLTKAADTLGVAVVAAAITVLLFVRRWGHAALLLLIGLGVELSVFLSTNYLVARPRPHVPHLGSTPSTFSWPSGHSAATFALYGGIAVIVMAATKQPYLRALAWTVAIGLTLAVALSRIYRGEHHPTDTMGGVALGVGALIAAVFVIRTWSAVTGQQSMLKSRDERRPGAGLKSEELPVAVDQ